MGRAILRLHEPTSGEVLFEGKDITKISTEEMRKLRSATPGLNFLIGHINRLIADHQQNTVIIMGPGQIGRASWRERV